MLTPADLVHLHLLLNHFPTVGLIVGGGVLALGAATGSRDLTRGGLAALFAIALIALPTYMTGYAAQRMLKSVAGVSQVRVDLHQRQALVALMFMEATGVAAWFGLWAAGRPGAVATGRTVTVLVLAVVTLGLMAGAATVGGDIRHPEILANPAGVPGAGWFAPAWLSSDFITRYQYAHAWAWKTLETIHFVGLCLLFGVVLVVDMRLMGGLRSAPAEGLHRLLPWGVWGFVANSVTGMMFYIGQAFQYVENPAFHLKMVCMLVAGANVLYLTWNEEIWRLKPGAAAPLLVRCLAGSQIALWVAVIYFGRMLPYIGDAF